MIHQIKMPSAGQTTDAAQIGAILVEIGDQVKRGDALLEAETDKAVLPVESFAAGIVLDILVEEGDEGVSPGAAPAPMPAAESEEEAEYRPIVAGGQGAKRPSAAPLRPAQAAKAYPALPNAKMLAKEMGVDIGNILPGNGMAVTRKDVLAADAAPVAPQAKSGQDYEVIPMDRMRATIARRMLESSQNIPAWQCTVRVNMEPAMALRDQFQSHRGVKLSYNDILAKAVAAASEKYPLIRARFEGGEIRRYHHMNIGIAVALEGALVVPVMKNVEEMGLEKIALQSKALIEKARNGALLPDDMGGGGATISNLGMFDVHAFTAIVNPPESCILAVGSIAAEPRWDGTDFVPMHAACVTGSFDHRMIDGAYGARFLQEVKILLENPALLLA